jgi:TM2 domain-containing membrane protein YozV
MKIGGNYCMPKKLVFILMFFLSFCDITPQVNNQINFNSQENILKFANFLYCDCDYSRAIAEFEKYLTFHNNDTVIFKIGLSYSNLGNIDNAVSSFKRLFSEPIFSDEARLETAKLNFRNKRYSELNMITFNPEYISSRYYPSIKILNNISILFENNPAVGSNLNDFVNIFPESAREEMKTFFMSKVNPPYKSPVFAAVLSAIIPGAGKIYTGFYGDGITAFVLTGILAYTSYSNFKADHIFRGWLFGGLTGVFYLGNIYGSAVSAQIHNAEVDLNFKINLESFLNKHNYFLPDEKYLCK